MALRIPRVPPAAGLMLGMLAGCADDHGYPSLALRPIEEVSLAEPVPRAVPAPTAPAIADARYAPLLEKARAGDAVFRARLAAARATLAAGQDAAPGSDRWGAAQQALSRLQDARGPAVEAVAALQAASEAPDTQNDRGLADGVARALDAARAIDAEEARALLAAAPLRS